MNSFRIQKIVRTHFKSRQSIYKVISMGLIGILPALILLFTTSLSNKYAMILSIGFISFFLIFIIKNKEQLLVAAYLFSLPISMGFKLIENEESTQYTAKLLFQLYLSDILLISIAFLLFFKIFLKRCYSINAIYQNKLILPLLLWIGMGFLSLIPAIDRTATIIGIVQMLRIFLTFAIIIILIERREDIHFLLTCLVLAYFSQALLLFAQYVSDSLVLSFPGATMKLDIVEEGLRPSGTMAHSSHFAKFSGLMLPIILSYVYFTPILRNKFLYFSIWFCGSIALLLTISRAGIATWLLSIIFFFLGLLYLRMIPSRKKIHLFIMSVFLISIALGSLYFIGGQRLSSRIAYDSGSSAARIPMWKVSLNVIKANPILGVGLKNYTLVHQDYDHTPEHISALLPDSPVHNIFLLYGAEIGIPGLIFFLWFICALLKSTLRSIRNELVPLNKGIYLGMMIGIVALLLQSATGKGVTDHLIHLSVIAIFAACVAKYDLLSKGFSSHSSI